MAFFEWFRLTKRTPKAGYSSNPIPVNERLAVQLVDEGIGLEEDARPDEAMQCYTEAIRLAPNFARGHLNQGNIFLSRGDANAAHNAYLAALKFDPDYAVAHFNLGIVQASLGQHQVALDSYLEALRIKPDFVDAEVALGNAQDELQQLEAAAHSYIRALYLKPDYLPVLYNLSNTQRRLGLFAEAVQSCRRALALQPNSAEAHHLLGGALQEQGNWREALVAFRTAVAMQVDNGEASIQAFNCAMHLCDWSHRDSDQLRLIDMVKRGVHGIKPFGLLNLFPLNGDESEIQRLGGRLYAESLLAGKLPTTMDLPSFHPNAALLSIGYLSADVHEHATMHLLKGVLEMHDKSRHAIYIYSYGGTFDSVTQQISKQCKEFRNIANLSDTSAAALIVADGIDILVDLKGFTKDYRIGVSACRPAPVIVSWLGYPGTLGHPILADYVIGDPKATPPESAAKFSETLALMPFCYQPNSSNKAIGVKPSRFNAGLPDKAIVFASFNQSYKLNPETFNVWCKLLAQVNGSVLWLLESSEQTMENLRREAAMREISPGRLVFAPKLPLKDHLGRLQLADLVLDTFPFNSHTTGSDALWAGVPMITLQGETFASRVAASLLHAIGLPELVTHHWDEYFVLAKSLAENPRSLELLRNRLAALRVSSPLFNTTRFTRDLERLYGRIWAQHKRGLKEIIVLSESD